MVVAVFGDFEVVVVLGLVVVVVVVEVAGTESVLDVRRFLAVGGEPAAADSVFLSLVSLLLLLVVLLVAASFFFF